MKRDNLHKGLLVLARNKPKETAIVFENRKLTYLELYERVKHLSNSLSHLGIKKGDHVILYMRNRLEMAELYYAFSVIGAVTVPINYMVKDNDLIELANNSDAKFAFIEQETKNDFTKVLPHLINITSNSLCLIGDADKDYINYSSLFKDKHEKCVEVQIESDDLATLIYSSGTTSLPKGIMLNHKTIITRLLRLAIEWGINYRSTVLITVPMYHSIGHHFLFTLPLLGCRIVISREFIPENTLQIIQDERVTHSVFVPTQYIMMLQVPNLKKYNLSSLQRLISGGAPIAQSIKESIIHNFKCELSEFFGCSETGNFIYLGPGDVLRKSNSIGQQAIDAEIRLVDEKGEDVEAGEEGEFAVRTESLFVGYYNQPEQTKKAFLKGGWFLTGDMGKIDDDGFYYLLDRKKDMIISGGVNVYSKDIEEIIYSHKDVLETAVVGVPDSKWGERVKAFVVLKENANVKKEDLITFCNERLAKYQQIKELEFMNSLPKNPSGKILKRILREKDRVLG